MAARFQEKIPSNFTSSIIETLFFNQQYSSNNLQFLSQALCPVCRESINCDVDTLWLAPPPLDVESATDFSVTAELRELQQQMAKLYLYQQQRGGIIDLEAEGVKMLVRTEDETNATAEHNPPNPPAGTSLNVLPQQPVLQKVMGNILCLKEYRIESFHNTIFNDSRQVLSKKRPNQNCSKNRRRKITRTINDTPDMVQTIDTDITLEVVAAGHRITGATLTASNKLTSLLFLDDNWSNMKTLP